MFRLREGGERKGREEGEKEMDHCNCQCGATGSTRVECSGTDGASAVKKPKTQRRVFTGAEKAILEDRYKNDLLNDKKSREDVVVLISGDGNPLSAEQVRIWVDNFKASLKKNKD